jgi:hypothetical protein
MKTNIMWILFLMTVFTICAQDSEKFFDCATNPPDFNKLSYEEADNMLYDETRKRICPEYIANLVTEIQRGNLSDDKKTLAVYLLGELHPIDTNSIEVLIGCIDFKTIKLDGKTRFSRWGQYPAKEALIKIGKPVIDPILNHLPDETNPLRRQLMCDVLKQVLRHQ